MSGKTNVHRAIAWINEELKKADSDMQRAKLISDACCRFNLSPGESEILLKTFKKA